MNYLTIISVFQKKEKFARRTLLFKLVTHYHPHAYPIIQGKATFCPKWKHSITAMQPIPNYKSEDFSDIWKENETQKISLRKKKSHVDQTVFLIYGPQVYKTRLFIISGFWYILSAGSKSILEFILWQKEKKGTQSVKWERGAGGGGGVGHVLLQSENVPWS